MSSNVVRLVDRKDRLEDGVLVERARAGEREAKRALFERYVAYASAIALRLTGRDNEVEDIVQDSFVAAFEGLHRLDQPDAFKGWLASIVTRTAIGALRRKRLLRRLGFSSAEPLRFDALVSPSAPPDVIAELRAVYGAIERFPADERAALVLRRVERLELEEIAERTGASVSTVKRRIARAEVRLAQLVQEGGGR